MAGWLVRFKGISSQWNSNCLAEELNSVLPNLFFYSDNHFVTSFLTTARRHVLLIIIKLSFCLAQGHKSEAPCEHRRVCMTNMLTMNLAKILPCEQDIRVCACTIFSSRRTNICIFWDVCALGEAAKLGVLSSFLRQRKCVGKSRDERMKLPERGTNR